MVLQWPLDTLQVCVQRLTWFTSISRTSGPCIGICVRIPYASLMHTLLIHLQNIYSILLAAEFDYISVYQTQQIMNSLQGGIMSSNLCRVEMIQ